MKFNELIVKSNYMIEASYKLSVGEQRLIYILTSMINKDDDELKLYKLTVKDFINITNTSKNKNEYKYVASYVESLRRKDLTIVEKNKRTKFMWLSVAVYYDNEGIIELGFDPRLKKYLLQLKEKFTKMKLDTLVQFSSYYSARIYELLKQYESIKKREIEILDLKFYLGIEDNEYMLYSNFKIKVILRAQKEINERSDIYFEFEEVKIGRKVNSIKFYIKSNDTRAIIDNPLKNKENNSAINRDNESGAREVMAILKNCKISRDDAIIIYERSNGDIEQIKEVYEYSKNQDIKNLVGYMIEMVVPGKLQKNIKKPKEEPFVNYSQRKNIDFEKLEREYQGWDKVDDTIADTAK